MTQPGSTYGDSTRANDADRADVCTILDIAYADGQLDGDEHRQRCSSAMSAKTRNQLLDLTSDLQARLPAFAQSPTIAVNDGPDRGRWIVWATAGASLAVLFAIVGFIIAGFNNPSPSSGPAPTAPAAAHTDTLSAQATGTFLPLADVVATVSGDFQDSIGHAPQQVTCPGDLDGKVGAFERCSITDGGKHYSADVTVTKVEGNRITTHEAVNEDVSPSPSPSGR